MTDRPPLTARDLALMPQTVRRSVPIGHWQYTDGTPVRLSLRGRTVGERADCIRAATKAGQQYGVEFDEDTHAVETVWYALESPRLDASQKSMIWDWHPAVLDEIVTWVHLLETLTADAFDTALLAAEAERVANLVAGATAKAQARPRARRDRAGVAAPDRTADEPADRAA